MVYITGDIHGDFSRFTSPAAKRLKAGDILAVCGDFGFFWDDSKQERRLRAKLEKLPYTPSPFWTGGTKISPSSTNTRSPNGTAAGCRRWAKISCI